MNLRISSREGAIKPGSPRSLAGTVKLATIAARDDYVEPFHMTDVNGMLFFVLYDNGGESFVWKSDGAVAGTQLIELGEPWRYPGGLTNIKNQVFFTMGNSDVDDGPRSSLWRGFTLSSR